MADFYLIRRRNLQIRLTVSITSQQQMEKKLLRGGSMFKRVCVCVSLVLYHGQGLMTPA